MQLPNNASQGFHHYMVTAAQSIYYQERRLYLICSAIQMQANTKVLSPKPATNIVSAWTTRWRWSQHILCNELRIYEVDLEQKDMFLVVGCLERGMLHMAHIINKELKEHGWFILTCKSKNNMESVLFENQVRMLRDVIRRDHKECSAEAISWLTRENAKGIVVYVNYSMTVSLLMHNVDVLSNMSYTSVLLALVGLDTKDCSKTLQFTLRDG
ncbi:hypothetical protein EDD85DRAFT_785230 [Armillaria nabsnona]|nr:hypothetical protein EDD85DRAFT_785230 [Armillaria nabsnona]